MLDKYMRLSYTHLVYQKRMKDNHVNKLIVREISSRELDFRKAAPYFGCSYQCVNQWARGETSPSDKTLITLIQSKHSWVSDLAFRCLLIRYPAIMQVLEIRARTAIIS